MNNEEVDDFELQNNEQYSPETSPKNKNEEDESCLDVYSISEIDRESILSQ